MRKSTGSTFLVEDFIAQANNRLNVSLGKQEKERDHLLSTIDQAYNHVLSKAGSELSAEVMTTLKKLYKTAKDGIEAMVTSARISHEEDDRVFETASWTLQDDLKDHLVQEIREERREATDLKAELVTTGDDSDYRVAKSSDDEPKTGPRTKHRKRRSSGRPSGAATPDSGGRSFINALSKDEAKSTKAKEELMEKPVPLSSGSVPSWGRDDALLSTRELAKSANAEVDSGKAMNLSQKAGGSKLESNLEPEFEKAETTTSGDRKPDGVDSMVRDLLVTGDDLTAEFCKDMNADGDEWPSDGEGDGDGEGQVFDLERDLEEAKKTISKKKDAIKRMKEITKSLKKENEELQKENDSLRSIASERGNDAGSSTKAAPTPASDAFSPKSTPLRFSQMGSVASSPGLGHAAWVRTWLPQCLKSHRDRLRTAAQRCAREEEAHQKRMAECTASSEARTGQQQFQAQVDSTRKHRRDFNQTLAFFEEIKTKLRSDASRGVALSDELEGMAPTGESAPPTGVFRPHNVAVRPVSPPPEPEGQEAPGLPSSRDATIIPKAATPLGRVEKTRGPSRGRAVSFRSPSDLPKARDPPKSTKDSTTAPKMALPFSEGCNIPQSQDGDHPDPPDPSDERPSDERPSDNALVTDDSGQDTATETLISYMLGMAQNLWTMSLKLVLLLAKQVGADVRVFIFFVHCFIHVCTLAYKAISPSRQQHTVTGFPRWPSLESFWTTLTHVLLLMALQAYVACVRERHVWFEANGLTRQYMLRRAQRESWWMFLAEVDSELTLGLRDVIGMVYKVPGMSWKYLKEVKDWISLLAGVGLQLQPIQRALSNLGLGPGQMENLA